ncbi:tetratricopeptide repeat protein [Lacinutrix sp. MEBiC02404]
MNRTVLLLTAILSFSTTFSQTINQQVLDEKGKEMLLGPINKEGLTKAPFRAWFNKNYEDYDVNEKIAKKLKDSLKEYTIKVFLGTWCGDSKKEVPQFYNILETANFPETQLEVIALDTKSDAYKQGPNGEEKGMNIHRVPTFIFYKNGKEVNRIVEHPQETIERDMLKIVTGERYYPKYYVANVLFNNLEKYSMDEMQKSKNYYLTNFPEYSEGSKELNTLGYVYKKDKQFEKALYVFDLNTKIFPNNANVYDSLGEAYFETENYSEALKNYNKVLELKPEDKNALEMMTKVKLKLDAVSKEN